MRHSTRPKAMRTLTPLALLLSALLVAGCSEDDDPSAEPSPSDSTADSTESPSPSASSTPTESVPPATEGESRLTTSGLDEGLPPAVAYVRALDPTDAEGAWELVRADGSTLALPGAGDVGSFASMGRGLVALADDGSGPTVRVIDGAGSQVRRTPALGYSLAVTPDGSIVGWLGTDHAPQFLEASGKRTGGLPKVPKGADLGALRGEGTCFESESVLGGCTAYVNSLDASRAYVSTSHGIVDVAGKMKSVADVSPTGRVVGLVSITDAGSCSGVWKNTFRRPLWQTCDFTLTSFSPDGSRLLGTDPYLDGIGQRTLAFLDGKTGEVLHTFVGGRNGPPLISTAWEDDDHALALVLDGTEWAVLRLGVDGSMEYAVAPVPGDEIEPPFGLPAG